MDDYDVTRLTIILDDCFNSHIPSYPTVIQGQWRLAMLVEETLLSNSPIPIPIPIPINSLEIEDSKLPKYARLRDAKRAKGSKGRHRNRYGRGA
jgi:hypothetical protein